MSENYQKQAEYVSKDFAFKRNNFASSTIIGLLVKGPRLFLPKKKSFNKMSAQYESLGYDQNNSALSDLRTTNLAYSTIWNPEVTESLRKSKKTTHEINKIRSTFLLPGTQLTQHEDYCHIPILLVKNTVNNSILSAQNGSMFDGWDLIVPRHWAMAF